ncbi:transcriptional regulator, TetR family [Arthrobacter sp. cf158]|uniref:TetR/AcrR family transcriptional regulator n=1 Tax=Arthrobacter sp. cf158 TaxID=1761744 RepID=UPI0008960ABA|nr:TetR family transcriptional regulator [Arthrobacter sp. cf158]SDX19735.1 transcriptional regulator, TetR family [Arthrobacter sp. cf158]
MRSNAEDLTTRARIRDAAIGLFGRDGFTRATVRAVASAAGVSPGLVIHHFGSKAGLREACDRHVLAQTATQGREKTDPGSTRQLIQDYLNHPDQYANEISYIRQSLGDESAAGDAFFDAVVRQTQDIIQDGIDAGTIRKVDDVRSTAVVIASNSLSILMLGRHLSRTLGAVTPEPHGIGPELLRHLTLPALDIYTHGFYTDSRFLDAARDALRQDTPTKEGSMPRDPGNRRRGVA